MSWAAPDPRRGLPPAGRRRRSPVRAVRRRPRLRQRAPRTCGSSTFRSRTTSSTGSRRARERWGDAYRLETYTDGLPDELVAGYCRVSNLLNVDAPTGAVDFEAETLTPERYRGYLDLERRQGRRLTTVAIEDATGEVVAYTDLVLPSGAPTKVWRWGTLVDRAHQGHRLGMAVKVANLRELQWAHPERQTVSTGNDATNSYMVGINVELGFHVAEVARMCRKVLTDL